ncbi:hypothetical protein J6P92_03140 [bacterium]|nr:hypothetical protein [bacterium]
MNNKANTQNINKNFKKNLTGLEAVMQMLLQKRGIIKNAFYRKDIGHIDLIWGDGSKGLSHIIKRRGKDEKPDIENFVFDMVNVIINGERSKTLNNRGRWEIRMNGKIAIIEPKETNGKRTFLLTAYCSRNAK